MERYLVRYKKKSAIVSFQKDILVYWMFHLRPSDVCVAVGPLSRALKGISWMNETKGLFCLKALVLYFLDRQTSLHITLCMKSKGKTHERGKVIASN